MKSVSIISLLICLVSVQVLAQESNERYTYKKGDPQGINKWYMGRQIAYVMGFQGMAWLERQEREQEERTSLLLQNMDLQSTDVIADIGAGSGYHVFQMAPKTKEGKIYAVDIQPEMLAAIASRKEKEGYDHIETIKGSLKSVELPPNSIDKVLMVDVYHEFEYPFEIMETIKEALKPTGKIYLIEYRKEDRRVPIKEIHKMTEKQAIKEMNAVGFVLEENLSNLPWQHCMVFIRGQEK